MTITGPTTTRRAEWTKCPSPVHGELKNYLPYASCSYCGGQGYSPVCVCSVCGGVIPMDERTASGLDEDFVHWDCGTPAQREVGLKAEESERERIRLDRYEKMGLGLGRFYMAGLGAMPPHTFVSTGIGNLYRVDRSEIESIVSDTEPHLGPSFLFPSRWSRVSWWAVQAAAAGILAAWAIVYA